MNTHMLMNTARALVADNKGLLAMDESNPTCNRRFARLGIPETEDARSSYRDMSERDLSGRAGGRPRARMATTYNGSRRAIQWRAAASPAFGKGLGAGMTGGPIMTQTCDKGSSHCDGVRA